MISTTPIVIIEMSPQDALERRMTHVVELVNLAQALGYPINGFTDENDLMKKMKSVELDLLHRYIAIKESNTFIEDQLRAELEVEKFHSIACRILDALEKY
ncbi:hypothetical protein IT409_02290 [Candidatus Falkowbacteria bacterium]|nr:hypothetical protein [Candidatus Falkowbacteria bacterium]